MSKYNEFCFSGAHKSCFLLGHLNFPWRDTLIFPYYVVMYITVGAAADCCHAATVCRKSIARPMVAGRSAWDFTCRLAYEMAAAQSDLDDFVLIRLAKQQPQTKTQHKRCSGRAPSCATTSLLSCVASWSAIIASSAESTQMGPDLTFPLTFRKQIQN